MSGAEDVEYLDYLIIGAGQAGLVLKHFLKSERVVVVDPAPFTYRIGESIVPEQYQHPELQALLPAIAKLPSYTPKMGVTFVTDRHVTAFPLTEKNQREAMHVARAEVDALMAEAWKIDVRRERVESFDPDTGVVRTDARTYHVKHQVLDCSGPAMVVAGLLDETLNLQPIHAGWAYYDVLDRDDDAFADVHSKAGRKLSHYDARRRTVLDDSDFADWPASHTTILSKSMAGTWCWQIPLFGADRLSFGVVSREAPITEALLDEVVSRSLAPCFSSVRARPRDGDSPYDRFHTRNGFARRAQRAAGDRFILVGDAFAFADPVYSIGTALAVNKALEVAFWLNNRGWGPEARDGYSAEAEALIARASQAFEFWYDEQVVSNDAAAAEVREGFLVGSAVTARPDCVEHYGQWLDDVRLKVGEARDTVQVVDEKLGSVRGKVAELLGMAGDEQLAGWALADAKLSTDGLFLTWQHADKPELVLLALPDADEAFGRYREVGRLALSYMSPWGDDYPFDGRVDALFVEVIERMGDGAAWVALDAALRAQAVAAKGASTRSRAPMQANR